jgi:trehalose/maltose hydrolase-like predicted phosphorylase
MARVIANTLILLLAAATTTAQPGNSSTVYQTRFDGVTWDATNWVLTTTNLEQGRYQARVTVANGYHGMSVASLGPFFEVETELDGDNINGWPLFNRRQTFGTVGGFWDSQPTTNGSNFPWLYQYGWDTAISGIPHWAGLVADLGGNNYLAANTNKSQISHFSSSLDMKRGVKSWKFTWTPGGNRGSFNVSYEMFAHKLYVNQAFVNMTITASKTTNITIADVLNGDAAVRTNPGQKGFDTSTGRSMTYTSVSPLGVHNVSAWIFSALTSTDGQEILVGTQGQWDRPYVGNNQSSAATAYSVVLRPGQPISISKNVGIASSDAFATPKLQAMTAAMNASETGWTAALASHVEEWAKIFPSDSVDDFSFPENGTLPNDEYIIDASVTAVTNSYYLLQNTLTQSAINATTNVTGLLNSHSIAVGGLGSDSYAGQVFWDAEIW